MKKVFNATGLCVPEKHYMVNLSSRLNEVKALVEQGAYFTVNRARQYGKTTPQREPRPQVKVKFPCPFY